MGLNLPPYPIQILSQAVQSARGDWGGGGKRSWKRHPVVRGKQQQQNLQGAGAARGGGAQEDGRDGRQ